MVERKLIVRPSCVIMLVAQECLLKKRLVKFISVVAARWHFITEQLVQSLTVEKVRKTIIYGMGVPTSINLALWNTNFSLGYHLLRGLRGGQERRWSLTHCFCTFLRTQTIYLLYFPKSAKKWTMQKRRAPSSGIPNFCMIYFNSVYNKLRIRKTKENFPI